MSIAKHFLKHWLVDPSPLPSLHPLRRWGKASHVDARSLFNNSCLFKIVVIVINLLFKLLPLESRPGPYSELVGGMVKLVRVTANKRTTVACCRSVLRKSETLTPNPIGIYMIHIFMYEIGDL